MNLMKGISFLLLMLVVTSNALALSGARLINQSSSGRTVLFNLGIHDGVKEGDYAVIVKEIRNLETRDLRIVPVAKARNVKINTGNSVWILYKIFDSELLIKGDKYLILAESTMLSGRRDPRLGRISVITEKDKVAYQTTEALGDDKDRLSRLKTQYPEVAPVHERDRRSDGDGELLDVEGWKKFKGSKYRTALYKSPYQKDFQRELRLETFQKMVTAYLNKVNEPGFNYDQFYDEQKKDAFANEFRQRSNFNSEYESFLSYQAQKATSDAKLYRSLLEKGESWSEDFSDEELKAVLNSVSVLQEKDRKDFVMSDPNRHTVFLGYGMGFSDSQTEKDTGFRRDHLYQVDLDFETIPIIKHETLERFTLNASVRSNKTAFESENQNVSFDETSFTLGANWYPLYAPYVTEAPVIFLGLYFRSGWGQAVAPTVNEKANYTVLSAPGVRAGMKYNFRNNLGIRLMGTLESMSLDSYEQSKIDAVLPNSTSLPDGKLNFALAYSF